MKKSGITMVSIIIYVMLFFVFTTFAILISSNMNYKTLSDKGDLYINEQFQKLQYNLVKSSTNSEYITKINNKIVFSNNDEYTYNTEKKQILKNGGIIAGNVESFNILETTNLTNKPENFDYNIDENKTNILIEVKFKKYGKEKKAQIFVVAGDDNSV